MRFLFTTLQFRESDFYGRVGAELARRGHEVAHVTYSRRAAAALRARGFGADCLPDRMAALGPLAPRRRRRQRIVERYGLPTLRDVWKTDPGADGLDEGAALERTVRHFRALEAIFDELAPDVVVPEVGSETMRTAAHLVGAGRAGSTVLFLFYTIFPDPLRLYREHDARADRRARGGAGAERRTSAREVERVHRRLHGRRPADPRLPRPRVHAAARCATSPATSRVGPRTTATTSTCGRSASCANVVRERARAAAARRLYEPLEPPRARSSTSRCTSIDDYKIKRVIPHCDDQASIIEQVADALPHGLRPRAQGAPDVDRAQPARRCCGGCTRLPERRASSTPHTSSHELIRRAAAVAVISSTVGLEALLYGKPVLTLGQPFYAGYGVTVDVDSFREIREAVPGAAALPPRPRAHPALPRTPRCARAYPGKPVLVDDSGRERATLAALARRARCARRAAGAPRPSAPP